jgi:hypothetical protein
MNNFRAKLLLPAAGYRASYGFGDAGNYGYYWSNLGHADSYNTARQLNFYSAEVFLLDPFGRDTGFPLRCFKN